MAAADPLALELRGVTKRFPGVVANDHIDLQVRRGDIHAIVGENGAGKTTLMSTLYGMLAPDEGEILVRGEPLRLSSPLDAIAAGLGMVHQAFQLFPTLTVAENVVFRAEPSRLGVIDRAEAVRQVTALADEYGLAVEPRAVVETLPVGVRQRVEILKALYRDAEILILDEPTAVLTPQERDGLFAVMRALKAKGRTIVFITHKLGEVMAVADRVTVLRAGCKVADRDVAETTPAEIARHMTGRDVAVVRRAPTAPHGRPLLTVRGLTVDADLRRRSVQDVDLEIHAGEIVGIAGVAGNGQTELVEAIVGLRQPDAGTVAIQDRDVTFASVAQRRRAGLAYIPEDRHRLGTCADAPLWANTLMGNQHDHPFQRRGWLAFGRVRDHAANLVRRFDIRVRDVDTPVGTLSGGNLQKVVVAREMDRRAPVLIAEQPTRGVDLGAVEFLHDQLTAFRDDGGAVLLVSAELSEIQALATRILVMFEGRIVAELDPDSVDESEIGLYMTGSRVQGAEVPR